MKINSSSTLLALIAMRLDSATRHVTLDFGGGDSADIGLAGNIAIQTLQFADGSSQGIQAFLSDTRFDIAGTAAADTLMGTPFNDRIDGKGGNDVLAGGAGSDVYSYNAGDGADTIYDNGRYFGFPGADGNTLKFGPGITPDMIQARHEGNAGVLDLGGGDSIVVGWRSGRGNDYNAGDRTIGKRVKTNADDSPNYYCNVSGKAANDEAIHVWRLAA